MEVGEQPAQAVLRELKEEFEIEVSELSLLLEHVEEGGEFPGIYHSFVANLVTPINDVKCNEGVCAEFFHPEIAIDFPQHPVSRLFLRTYMESRLRNQPGQDTRTSAVIVSSHNNADDFMMKRR